MKFYKSVENEMVKVCLPGKTLSRQRGQACVPAIEKGFSLASGNSSVVHILDQLLMHG